MLFIQFYVYVQYFKFLTIVCFSIHFFNESQHYVSTTGRIKCFMMGVIFGVVLLAFFTLSISLVTNPMLIKSLPGMLWK